MTLNQTTAWDEEYIRGTFLTSSQDPTAAFTSFVRWYERKAHYPLTETNFIDVGCGNGRHALLLASKGAHGIGFDVSKTAIAQAKTLAAHLPVVFTEADTDYLSTLPTSSAQLIIDVTTSHCIMGQQRINFVSDVVRLLAPNGIFYSRVLAQENKHVARLIQIAPGTQPGSYVLPGTSIQERPVSLPELKAEFKVLHLIKQTCHSGYTRFGTQAIRRNYWETIWQKMPTE